MTEKELRKLNRAELLEMLIEVSEENDRIQAENTKLQELLKQRRINLSNAGTIAEAAMQVNGVFAAAQAASEQYLENIRMLSDNAQGTADAILSQAKAECNFMREKAKKESDDLFMQTKARCDALKENAQREADAKWAELKGKLDHYVAEHEAIMNQFGMNYSNRPSGTQANRPDRVWGSRKR